MSRHEDRSGKTRADPQTEKRDQRERTVAPPIEREHETQAGIREEDEKREKQEKQQKRPDERR